MAPTFSASSSWHSYVQKFKSLVIVTAPVIEFVLAIFLSAGVLENVLVARHILHRPLLLGAVAISITQ